MIFLSFTSYPALDKSRDIKGEKMKSERIINLENAYRNEKKTFVLVHLDSRRLGKA